jgi:2-iminobutanoate/2-iminopropanoate deaminase
VGPLLATSRIHGIDPATAALAEGAEAQVRHAFENMRGVVEAGGASLDDVVQVLVALTDRANRPHVNAVWTDLFPDPASRPARNSASSWGGHSSS